MITQYNRNVSQFFKFLNFIMKKYYVVHKILDNFLIIFKIYQVSIQENLIVSHFVENLILYLLMLF
jgi:hypothetical protein